MSPSSNGSGLTSSDAEELLARYLAFRSARDAAALEPIACYGSTDYQKFESWKAKGPVAADKRPGYRVSSAVVKPGANAGAWSVTFTAYEDGSQIVVPDEKVPDGTVVALDSKAKFEYQESTAEIQITGSAPDRPNPYCIGQISLQNRKTVTDLSVFQTPSGGAPQTSASSTGGMRPPGLTSDVRYLGPGSTRPAGADDYGYAGSSANCYSSLSGVVPTDSLLYFGQSADGKDKFAICYSAEEVYGGVNVKYTLKLDCKNTMLGTAVKVVDINQMKFKYVVSNGNSKTDREYLIDSKTFQCGSNDENPDRTVKISPVGYVTQVFNQVRVK